MRDCDVIVSSGGTYLVDHYHFDHWGEYQLCTRAAYDSWMASGRAIGGARFIGAKTTSCVMDEELVRQLPGTPYPALPAPLRTVGAPWLTDAPEIARALNARRLPGVRFAAVRRA